MYTTMRKKINGILLLTILISSCSDGNGDSKPSFKAPTGVVKTLAGSTAGFENGTSAKFKETYGMVTDASGNIYVADYSNNAIRKITPTGSVSTFVGGEAGDTDGTGTDAKLRGPVDIDIDAAGNFYVVEYNGNRVRKVTKDGLTSVFAGSITAESGTDDNTGVDARFSNPLGVAVNTDGNIYVTDRDHAIRKITSAKVVTTIVGQITDGETVADFDRAFGIAADGSGNLIVADYDASLIRKVTPAGNVSTIAGSTIGFKDDTGTAAQFSEPIDVTVDKAGNIYVADKSNHRIRKITSAGVVTTLAGTNVSGADDGTGANAKFNNPGGITIDHLGNLYVSDTDNYRIRKIN
jgi:sugar lactone lactonase YvrE